LRSASCKNFVFKTSYLISQLESISIKVVVGEKNPQQKKRKSRTNSISKLAIESNNLYCAVDLNDIFMKVKIQLQYMCAKFLEIPGILCSSTVHVSWVSCERFNKK
jgi:hypothetical protein